MSTERDYLTPAEIRERFRGGPREPKIVKALWMLCWIVAVVCFWMTGFIVGGWYG